MCQTHDACKAKQKNSVGVCMMSLQNPLSEKVAYQLI